MARQPFKKMQSLLNPRNLFHISSSDLDIQEGQHVQTSDLFKFAFLIQTHTRKWLQWLKVTPPWQVLGYLTSQGKIFSTPHSRSAQCSPSPLICPRYIYGNQQKLIHVCLFILVVQVLFGGFDLVGFVWQVWFNRFCMFDLSCFVWQVWFCMFCILFIFCIFCTAYILNILHLCILRIFSKFAHFEYFAYSAYTAYFAFS